MPRDVSVAGTVAAAMSGPMIPLPTPRAVVPHPLPPMPDTPAPMPAAPSVVQPTMNPRASDQLRRCTFRRLTLAEPAGRGAAAVYQVECLYAGREAPLALGDLLAARRICDPCGNPGIFRADED